MASLEHLTPRPLSWRTQWLAGQAVAYREYLLAKRFAAETLAGPMFSAVLYLTVISLALGTASTMQEGAAIVRHMAAGLALTGLVAAAQTTAASFIVARHENALTTLLMAPMHPITFVLGFCVTSVGFALVGAAGILLMGGLFTPLEPRWGILALFLPLGCTAMALVGFLVGLWAKRWDQFSALFDIGILPMTLISGVYVPISMLPAAMQPLSWVSPLTYIVGGVRHGATGYDEMPLWLCLAVVVGLNLILAAAAMRLVRRGWRLVD